MNGPQHYREAERLLATTTFTEGALYLDRHGDVWRHADGDFIHVKRPDDNTLNPSANPWVEDAHKVAADFGPMRHLTDRLGPAHEALLLWALQGKNTDDADVLDRAHVLIERARTEATR